MKVDRTGRRRRPIVISKISLSQKMAIRQPSRQSKKKQMVWKLRKRRRRARRIERGREWMSSLMIRARWRPWRRRKGTEARRWRRPRRKGAR